MLYGEENIDPKMTLHILFNDHREAITLEQGYALVEAKLAYECDQCRETFHETPNAIWQQIEEVLKDSDHGTE